MYLYVTIMRMIQAIVIAAYSYKHSWLVYNSCTLHFCCHFMFTRDSYQRQCHFNHKGMKWHYSWTDKNTSNFNTWSSVDWSKERTKITQRHLPHNVVVSLFFHVPCYRWLWTIWKYVPYMNLQMQEEMIRTLPSTIQLYSTMKCSTNIFTRSFNMFALESLVYIRVYPFTICRTSFCRSYLFALVIHSEWTSSSRTHTIADWNFYGFQELEKIKKNKLW